MEGRRRKRTPSGHIASIHIHGHSSIFTTAKRQTQFVSIANEPNVVYPHH